MEFLYEARNYQLRIVYSQVCIMKLVLYGYGVQEVSAMHCVFDAIGLVYFPAFLAAGADRCEKTKRIIFMASTLQPSKAVRR